MSPLLHRLLSCNSSTSTCCRRLQSTRAVTNNKIDVTKTTTTSSNTFSIQNDATSLVDKLLMQTSEFLQSGTKRNIVAYSGGVDSSLVVALLMQLDSTNTQAVLGISPSLSKEQLHQARRVASHLHVPLVQVATSEQSNPVYLANAGQACLACKTHLYAALTSISQHYSSQNITLYNGTNKDDLQDSTRVGLLAAMQYKVQSPLAQITKSQVRQAAHWLGLPNYNVAASPCLRSRLALGVEATAHHLQMIEQGERFVRNMVDISPTRNLRVRMLTRQRAMIEVDTELLDKVSVELHSMELYFKELGFSSVAVRPFQSGSVAAKQQRRKQTADKHNNGITEKTQEVLVNAAVA